MTRYVQGVNPPTVGTKATVYEMDKQTETTVGGYDAQGLVVLFKGQKGEEPAGQAANGEWYTARTDNLVVFADDVLAGDEFHTVNDGGTQEVWSIKSDRNDEYFATQMFDDVEITRRFARDRRGNWVCIDDPDGFTGIIHKPTPPLGIVIGTGPHTGDLTTRVVNGRSLLFRVMRVDTRDRYKVAELTWINAPASATDLHTQVYWTPEMGEWRWNDAEEKVVFTSGSANEVALKATRLDALHKTLREKYFHYENQHATETAWAVMGVLRDEITELLFEVETGVRPDKTWDPQEYPEFCNKLHEEWEASREQ